MEQVTDGFTDSNGQFFFLKGKRAYLADYRISNPDIYITSVETQLSKALELFNKSAYLMLSGHSADESRKNQEQIVFLSNKLDKIRKVITDINPETDLTAIRAEIDLLIEEYQSMDDNVEERLNLVKDIRTKQKTLRERREEVSQYLYRLSKELEMFQSLENVREITLDEFKKAKQIAVDLDKKAQLTGSKRLLTSAIKPLKFKLKLKPKTVFETTSVATAVAQPVATAVTQPVATVVVPSLSEVISVIPSGIPSIPKGPPLPKLRLKPRYVAQSEYFKHDKFPSGSVKKIPTRSDLTFVFSDLSDKKVAELFDYFFLLDKVLGREFSFNPTELVTAMDQSDMNADLREHVKSYRADIPPHQLREMFNEVIAMMY